MRPSATSARADLHLHSRHSNRPSEWFLRQVAAPESFSDPLALYRLCRARGMDFVTISDHDSVAGALEIAHLPGTFLSSEVTVRFPEDGTRIHCLVLGVTEAQHAEIERCREDLYAFRNYVHDAGILHSVAHPLYRVDAAFSLDHLERLLVLFDRFETRNGMHDRRINELLTAILAQLTPDMLADLAERHHLAPRSAQPWAKTGTGGSDDHGGLFAATTWTETPPAASVQEFLAHLAAGRHQAGGESGSALRLARSLGAISSRYLEERFGRGLGRRRDPFASVLRTLGRPEEVPKRAFAFFRRPTEPPGPAAADALIGAAIERFLRKSVGRFRRGQLAGSVGALAELVPVAAALAPFSVAFRTQSKDDGLLRAVAGRFGVGHGAADPNRKLWVTDTLHDVNGVARTIRSVGALAERRGQELVTLVCAPPDQALPVDGGRIEALTPLRSFTMPGYESLTLTVPPVLELLSRMERGRFGEVIVSTPGPVGLAALGAARLLGLKTTGIYHTDFPLYLRFLTGEAHFEELAWGYMRWFFGGLDRLYVPSRFYGDLLVEHGFARARLALMPRGVDAERFHPRRRDSGFWRRYGLDEAFTLLYVGRLSPEKNLDLLGQAFLRLRERGRPVQLAIVGDGPDRGPLEARYGGVPGVAFTGFLDGDELATAYASADLFAFPSTTDTFGNVILEAHAAGLPAVVTPFGGPQEIVRRHDSGLVAEPTVAGFADALALLQDRGALRLVARERALGAARSASWESFLDRLFGHHADLDPCAAPERKPWAA